MNWIDVSVPLAPEQPCWPGDEPFCYEETRTQAAGHGSNCARMRLSVHYGTHVDAPYHFVSSGRTVDQIAPDVLVGPCRVIVLRDTEELIEPDDLAAVVPEGTTRLLVRTKNSDRERDGVFHEEFVAFSEESARWLVERGVRLLGVDAPSIAPYGDTAPAHIAFLGASDVVIENLDLRQVEEGEYYLLCLPLKIVGSGGAPARVFLGEGISVHPA